MCEHIDECETIIISDGREPGEGVSPMLGSYPGVRLLSVEKCGRIGFLRNVGVGVARAPWCYFVDSDCVVQKDAIVRLIAVLGTGQVIRGRNVFHGHNWISRLDAEIRDERYSKNPTFAYCPNLAVRRDVFDAHGLFDPTLKYGSDGDFAKRLAGLHVEVQYRPEVVVAHECTDTVRGVFGKWMNYGEARYYRYRGEHVERKLATYFPNLFSARRGLGYNLAAVMCDVGRAAGMVRGYARARHRSAASQ